MGELDGLAHAARVLGLTRARVTQIANLALLAPAIQEEILAIPPVTRGREAETKRRLRPIVAEANWETQRALWSRCQRRSGAQRCDVGGSASYQLSPRAGFCDGGRPTNSNPLKLTQPSVASYDALSTSTEQQIDGGPPSNPHRCT